MTTRNEEHQRLETPSQSLKPRILNTLVRILFFFQNIARQSFNWIYSASFHYIDESVLLESKPLVKSISHSRVTSGSEYVIGVPDVVSYEFFL